MGHVYGFDLVGAGLGAALVVPAMWIVSAPTGIVVLGAVAALAAVLFAGPLIAPRRLALVVLAIGCVVTGFSASTGVNYLPSPYFPKIKPAADVWTPLDRVLGYAPRMGIDTFGYLFYDRVYAPVPIHYPGTPYPTWKQLLTSSESIGLAITRHDNVLVIGGEVGATSTTPSPRDSGTWT